MTDPKPTLRTEQEAFFSKVKIAAADECWEWQGCRKSKMYGGAQHKGRSIHAHRLSYMLNVGPIPDGLCVMHKCDNPPCVNPAHLQLGTPADNARDMFQKGRGRTWLAGITHCLKGHEFSKENTAIDHRGHRFCRTCKKASNRAADDRRTSAAAKLAKLQDRIDEAGTVNETVGEHQAVFLEGWRACLNFIKSHSR